MKLSKTAFAIAALLGAVATAQAATVSFTNITAAWYNADPATVEILNPDTSFTSANWGARIDPIRPPSGYDFATEVSASVEVPPSPSDPFLLGTFFHRNEPVLLSSALESINLRLTADLSIDGEAQGVQTYQFLFTHDETPNRATNGVPDDNLPCAYGGNNGEGLNIFGCADAVLVESLNTSDVFLIDTGNGVFQYTVDVFGFLCALCGDYTNTFLSQEAGTNSAELYFTVKRTEVPEPGMLALVGVGLLGAAAARRRKA